jgi:hypothetical protein
MNSQKSFGNLFYLTVIVIFLYLNLEIVVRLLRRECFSQVNYEYDEKKFNEYTNIQSKSLLQKLINDNILNYIWTTPKSVM